MITNHPQAVAADTWWPLWGKRLFDLVGAAALVICLSPLLLLTALGVKLTSRGPLIFLQDRAGKEGRIFQLLKFRTMRGDRKPDPKELVPPGHVDITPVGRLLRRSKIDELPQLLNVLKGEMSLVGPRPEMPFIAASYDEWQRRRLAVKPGITGLWQILGRKDLPMHENLQYDFYYIRNRSLALDLSILLRTLGAVLSRRGAF